MRYVEHRVSVLKGAEHGTRCIFDQLGYQGWQFYGKFGIKIFTGTPRRIG